jgi:hypothetical protein
MRVVAWVFGGVFALLAMGQTARAQTLVPPCGLMSQATAAAINGGPVAAGQGQDIPGVAKLCAFAGVGNAGQVTMGESTPTMGGMTTAQVFALGEKTAPTPGTVLTPLSGLGDGAYFTQSGPSFDVWVLVGQVILDVNAVPPQGAHPTLEAAMVAAAKTAVKGM